MAWGGKDNQSGPWGRPPGNSGGNGSGPRRPSGPSNPPPEFDIDAWLRRIQERLQQFFGGDGKENWQMMWVIAAVLAGIWLGSGIYLVRADEEGVVTRFGKYIRTTAPGIGYHLPYPIETVQKPRVTSVNRVEVGFHAAERTPSANIPEESLMLTGDENIVDINFEVQWKIGEAKDYLFNVRHPEATVKAVAESAMREIIGMTPIATVLAEGKLHVEQDTQALMQTILDHYNAGIDVVSVNLLKADPPSQVIDAFRDVQTARADMETARNQAEAYRNDIIPRARGEAQQIILDAEAYKQQVVNRAKGEAQRFSEIYVAYRDAKDVTRKRLYLETMENILQGMNKVIVENKNGVVPYLPLPALQPAAGKTEGAKP